MLELPLEVGGLSRAGAGLVRDGMGEEPSKLFKVWGFRAKVDRKRYSRSVVPPTPSLMLSEPAEG